MIKKIMLIVVSILLVGINVYAAGDLIVNGKIGVGTNPPSTELDVIGEIKGINTSTGSSTAYALSMESVVDDVSGSKAAQAGQFTAKHYGQNGRATGARYDILLQYSATDAAYTITQDHSAQNNVIQVGNNTGSVFTNAITQEGSVIGAAYAVTGRFTNNREINIVGDVNAINTSIASNSIGPRAVNMQTARNIYILGTTLNSNWTMVDNIGIEVEKQAAGTNNYGIVLSGDGAGSDIAFGPNKDVRIYSNAGELYVMDAGAFETQISPHDPVTGEWRFYSKNLKTGKVLEVNMEKLVRAVEKLTGETFMIESIEAIE